MAKRAKYCMVCGKIVRDFNKSLICEGCQKKTPNQRLKLIILRNENKLDNIPNKPFSD